MQEFHATCIPGAEEVLCDELRELGFASVRLNRGGIPLRGEWRDGWRACLQSRIAQRILVLLRRFPAADESALYAGAHDTDWNRLLSPRTTFAVSAVCRGSALQNANFAALKVKDAICDRLRDETGARPAVSRDDPDVRVQLYLANDKAALYADLSGESLHRRGYRLETGEAPLRETLAAAILRLSGWDRATPLVDPMCGSGTIAIEAAQWASNMAPGLGCERFGFERWASFGESEAAALRELRGRLREEVRPSRPRIIAGDADAAVLDVAKANARRAGVRLSFRHSSIQDLQSGGEKGVIVTNPPYGVRLAAEPDLVRGVAAALTRMHGWRACLLAGSPEYERALPLRPVMKMSLPNGDIDCDFLAYDIP
ncbi:MAG TPA: THUMP domain-containing protein [Kiritimatiellia bacterium]|nr:THUMP domain-containing protein [Kiritimatiellia bacterium]HRZ13210.1 THUMP domain-containing protein [Kiritimatiellia bacterium]HSA19728.1 THUMP domain-containing protein [Kiritimatiellia bacterium]